MSEYDCIIFDRVLVNLQQQNEYEASISSLNGRQTVNVYSYLAGESRIEFVRDGTKLIEVGFKTRQLGKLKNMMEDFLMTGVFSYGGIIF